MFTTLKATGLIILVLAAINQSSRIMEKDYTIYLSVFSRSFTISITRLGASIAFMGISLRSDQGPSLAKRVAMCSSPKDSSEML